MVVFGRINPHIHFHCSTPEGAWSFYVVQFINGSLNVLQSNTHHTSQILLRTHGTIEVSRYSCDSCVCDQPWSHDWLKDLRVPDYSGKSGGLWAEGQRWFSPPFLNELIGLACALCFQCTRRKIAKICISSSPLKRPRYRMLSCVSICPCVHLPVCPSVHVSTAIETQFFSISPLSDAFDFQFGGVILRLKEGLDVSHIQGQGKGEMVPLWNQAGINMLCEAIHLGGAGSTVDPHHSYWEPSRFCR